MARRRLGEVNFDVGIDDSNKIHGPLRHYNRTDSEIEDMIERVMARLYVLKGLFESARASGEKSAAMEAARNWKALEGVNQALRWALAEEGVDHPLY
jgi:hypothetical protein